MSSNLKVNNILPSTGDTVAVSGIASVTSSVSIASSCTATTFYGSGANLTSLPSQVTINNATANRVLTSDGGTTLNGEANLTFTGSILTVTNSSGASEITLVTPSANDSGVYFNDGSNSGALTYVHSDNSMRFRVNSSEKLRITSSGQLLVNTTSASISSNELFEVKSTGGGFSHFRNNSSTYAPIYIDNEASNGGATLVPLITMTDGGGNRAGFLLNNNSQFDISAAGSLSFSTGNNVGSATERLHIASDGRVSIGGLASPDGLLHIYEGSAGSVTADTSANLGVFESDQNNGGITILTPNTGKQNIYFGTTGTGGAYEAGIQYTHEAHGTTADRRNMVFRQGGGERMRIAGNGFTKMTNSDGNYHDITDGSHEMYSTITNQFVCRMRCTGNGYILYLDNNGATSAREFIEAYSRSEGQVKFRVNGSGNVYSRTNSFTGFSDVKLKENIVDASSQWDDIKSVKVRNFNFINDSSKTKMLGVVAQEIETVSAGLVEDNNDRDPDTNEDLGTTTKGVKYSILYMKAIKCLQEAQTRIETLEAEVAALKGS